MSKFLRTIFIFTLIVFVFFIHPCFAFVSQPIPLVLLPASNLSFFPARLNDSIDRLLQLDNFPASKTLRKFLARSDTNFLVAVEINLRSNLCSLSFHKLRAHLTYDDVGNRLTQETKQTQQTYGYDSIYQLTTVSGNQVHSYNYDSVGNREVVDDLNYTSNNLNQYTQVGETPYVYDANGNLTNDGVNAYTYDVENRLTSAICPLSSDSYTYDGFGRRISKTVDGNTIYFIYDGDQIIEERMPNGNLLTSYIYGVGIDEVLRMTRNGSDYYYHFDGLGSVTDITNSDGKLIESYDYDVYGNPSSTSSIGNRFYFTGREFDTETGLYYYRARYYSPEIGRFLQRDLYTWGPDDPRLLKLKSYKIQLYTILKEINKIEFIEPLAEIVPNLIGYIGQNYPQFLYPYLYTGNNPINLIDPYGLYTWPYTWQGWAGVILMGAGGVIFVTVPGGQTIGATMFFIGAGFSFWDLIEGFNAAENIGKQTGKMILERDREEWEEIDRELNINDKNCPK